MATSQAQIAANQANSQKSTGPKTDEGKAKSSRNRLSWGFASSTRFIPGENQEHFCALLNDLIREHQPATLTEQILVERMAHHHWISLRANRIQDVELSHIGFEHLLHLLPLLIRYQTTADRAFHKSHNELLKVQKLRGKSFIGFESKNAPQAGVPVATPAAKVAPETPPEAAPKPPDPPAKPEKSAPVTKVDLKSMSQDEVMAWLRTATDDEFYNSGL